GPDSTELDVTLKMVLVGLTLGPSIPLYVLAMQNGMPAPKIGVVTASATFFRQIGGTVGIAVLMTVFLTRLATGLAHVRDLAPDRRQLEMLIVVSDATRAVFQVAVVIVAIAFVQTLRLPEIELRKR